MINGRTLLLLHGAGHEAYRAARDRWAPAIGRQVPPDVPILVPSLPHPDSPSYASWSRAIQSSIAEAGEGVIVVAHSVSGAILLKLLCESGPIDALTAIRILAAPYWCGTDPEWDVPEFGLPQEIPSQIDGYGELIFFHGEDDTVVPVSHLAEYAERFPSARCIRIEDEGHMFEESELEWLKLDQIRGLN